MGSVVGVDVAEADVFDIVEVGAVVACGAELERRGEDAPLLTEMVAQGCRDVARQPRCAPDPAGGDVDTNGGGS